MAPPKKRLTDHPADLRMAIANGYEAGLSLAAIAGRVGRGKELVSRVVAMVVDEGELAERMPDRHRQTQKARAASVDGRTARRDAGRIQLSDVLLHELGPGAARRILARLAEEDELEAKVGDARRALEAPSSPSTPSTPATTPATRPSAR